MPPPGELCCVEYSHSFSSQAPAGSSECAPSATIKSSAQDCVERHAWANRLSLLCETGLTVKHKLQHFKQLYSWDCGLACAVMILRAIGQEQCDYAVLRGLCHTTSVWTIDLAHLLQGCGLQVEFTTITLGPNPAYSNESFYLAHLEDDERRVSQLFHEAPASGILLRQRSVCWQELAARLAHGNTLIIVLVDKRKLDPWSCATDMCIPYSLCGVEVGYTGHYILLVGWDSTSGVFLARDPAVEAAQEMRVSPVVLDAARTCFGTDEDVLFVTHPHLAQTCEVSRPCAGTGDSSNGTSKPLSAKSDVNKSATDMMMVVEDECAKACPPQRADDVCMSEVHPDLQQTNECHLVRQPSQDACLHSNYHQRQRQQHLCTQFAEEAEGSPQCEPRHQEGTVSTASAACELMCDQVSNAAELAGQQHCKHHNGSSQGPVNHVPDALRRPGPTTVTTWSSWYWFQWSTAAPSNSISMPPQSIPSPARSGQIPANAGRCQPDVQQMVSEVDCGQQPPQAVDVAGDTGMIIDSVSAHGCEVPVLQASCGTDTCEGQLNQSLTLATPVTTPNMSSPGYQQAVSTEGSTQCVADDSVGHHEKESAQKPGSESSGLHSSSYWVHPSSSSIFTLGWRRTPTTATTAQHGSATEKDSRESCVCTAPDASLVLSVTPAEAPTHHQVTDLHATPMVDMKSVKEVSCDHNMPVDPSSSTSPAHRTIFTAGSPFRHELPGQEQCMAGSRPTTITEPNQSSQKQGQLQTTDLAKHGNGNNTLPYNAWVNFWLWSPSLTWTTTTGRKSIEKGTCTASLNNNSSNSQTSKMASTGSPFTNGEDILPQQKSPRQSAHMTEAAQQQPQHRHPHHTQGGSIALDRMCSGGGLDQLHDEVVLMCSHMTRQPSCTLVAAS